MKLYTKRTAASLLAVALTITATGCGATAAAPVGVSAVEDTGILVTAAEPARGELALNTSFVGSVQPNQVIGVLPKMGGIVKEVKVTPGQSVKKGDVLMLLDDVDVRLSFQQAQDSYNATKAQVDQSIGSSFKTQLANLDGSYDSAYDRYEQSQVQRDALEQQYKDLLAIALPTPADLAKIAAMPGMIQEADDAVNMARKYYNNAKNTYNVAKTEGEAEAQTVADTTMKQAETGLAQAKTQLDYTRVLAPIDGVIESVSVTALNMASPSAPAFVISNKSALMVSFSVPSASIAALQVGESVTVEKGQNSYMATVTEVNTMIDAQTGLFTVKASMATAPTDLLTGVMVKVTAPTQKAENAILVAQDSVYFDNGKAYVYIATAEGLAKKVFVETGISTAEQMEILSGITDSDKVITSWHPNLLDGVKISLAS